MNQSVSRQGCDQINKRDRTFTEIEWWRFTKKQAAILTQVLEKVVCSNSDETLWNASRVLGVFRIGRLILTRFMWNGAGRCGPELGLHSLRYTSWYTSVSFSRGVILNHKDVVRKLEQKAYIIFATVDEMHKMNGLSNQYNTPSRHAGLAWGIGLAIIFMLLWLQC